MLILGEADKLLKAMSDYLAGLQRFSVQSDAIDEVVLTRPAPDSPEGCSIFVRARDS